jgi:hypothetical protein
MQVHQKLAVNCAVNPCTALLGCLNHEFSDSQWGAHVALGVCEEMFGLYGASLLGVSSAQELADMVLRVRGRGGGDGEGGKEMGRETLYNGLPHIASSASLHSRGIKATTTSPKLICSVSTVVVV